MHSMSSVKYTFKYFEHVHVIELHTNLTIFNLQYLIFKTGVIKPSCNDVVSFVGGTVSNSWYDFCNYLLEFEVMKWIIVFFPINILITV